MVESECWKSEVLNENDPNILTPCDIDDNEPLIPKQPHAEPDPNDEVTITLNVAQKILTEIHNLNEMTIENTQENEIAGKDNHNLKYNNEINKDDANHKNILKVIKKKATQVNAGNRDAGYCESVSSISSQAGALDNVSLLSKAINTKVNVGEIKYLTVILAFFFILYLISMVFFEVY